MEAPPPFFDESGQMVLLSSTEMGAALFSEEERQGRYTAERLRSSRPHVYQLAVSMLAEGLSYRAIQRATGLHHYTIQAVTISEPRLIEAEKERTAGVLKVLRKDTAEKLAEELPHLPIKNWTDAQKATIVLGIITEKSELLSGRATQRIARTEERLEDLEDHFSSLPDAIEADYMEITGFDGEPGAAKGPPEPEADPGAEDPETAL